MTWWSKTDLSQDAGLVPVDALAFDEPVTPPDNGD